MSSPVMIDCGGGVRLERGVPMRMSDGVVLVADHYYPPAEGPHPTLLMRQPYGRDIASTVVYAHPAWFARQGYNVVIQDVRGRGGSGGEFYPFRHERQDGAETIAALLERPECNGRIGMYGFSYQGMTQLLAAAAQPPGLRCIAPAMTAHDLYRGWFYNNGALRLASSLGWGLQMLKEDTRRLELREASARLESAWANLPAQYLATPFGVHPAIHGEGVPTYVRDWLEHDVPGEYWSSMDVRTCLNMLQIPALHVSGWYDTYLKGSVDGYRAMRAASGDNQYLLAGPWVHIPWGDRIGGTSLGEAANLDTDALLLRWFNHWLKDTGEFATEPRIRHFALSFTPNGGQWHNADAWPEKLQAFYLHSEGHANSSKGNGTLTAETPAASEPPDLFVCDPEVPVVAPGGIISASGPSNQAAMELGNNVLVYTGDTLPEQLHIFGTPEVAIYVATSAAASDLVTKLVCVRPNGDAIFVCIGIARSQTLFDCEYAADTPQLWRFELEPTSCIFAAGDRIRIEIASSAYPLYDRNPGNDVTPRLADSWNWTRSTQTIYHDAARPSAIYLPVIQEEGKV